MRNTETPTHVSGTTPDVILTDTSEPVSAWVDTRSIGLSDHSLVWTSLNAQVQLGMAAGLGRVLWSSGEDWDYGFLRVQHTLVAASGATDSARNEMARAVSAPVKRRRTVLDAAAWVRDLIVVFVGHWACELKVDSGRPPKRHCGPLPTPVNRDDERYAEYKESVN